MENRDPRSKRGIKPASLQLTDEEVAVLRECRFNSTVYRGLPLGTGCALFVRELIKRGRLGSSRTSSMYWIGAFAVGFWVGTASYRSKCFEKIMQLKDSNLAQQVQKFQKHRQQFPVDSSRWTQGSEINQAAPQSQVEKAPEWQKQQEEDEVNQKFPMEELESKPAGDKRVSFSDVRERHRRKGRFSSPPSSSSPEADETGYIDSRKKETLPDKKKGPVKTNKYGDPISD
eukprot:m.230430 g.230430  ORF g.230430 m.230430 type:complete len:230 (+) comp40059_c0_seq26:73-762(+)